MKKILKRVGIPLVIILGIGVSLMFIQGDMSVTAKVVINKPKQEVFDYLVMLKNQDNFSKWASMDPEMKKSYEGEDGTIGFVSRWESEKDDVGVGEQEITGIDEGKSISYELRFIEPFETTSQAEMKVRTTSDGTEISWHFEGKAPVLMLMLGMDENVKNDLDEGLVNLKRILEE